MTENGNTAGRIYARTYLQLDDWVAEEWGEHDNWARRIYDPRTGMLLDQTNQQNDRSIGLLDLVRGGKTVRLVTWTYPKPSALRPY
ncbi:unnamed protein product [Citrullus colocynthis]|uniref:Uncharacterized protein n=1 Tax=Citrullus colocynthis TaxID=252529 RepID=A0ABP0YC60_9ROSI